MSFSLFYNSNLKEWKKIFKVFLCVIAILFEFCKILHAYNQYLMDYKKNETARILTALILRKI